MTFEWADYLHLAYELAGQAKTPSTEEARLRSSVSRAYYAAFCRARNRLRDQESRRLPAIDVHRYVWEQFKNSNDLLRKKIGMDGDRLKKDRGKADYDDTVANLPALATKALKQSAGILEGLSRL